MLHLLVGKHEKAETELKKYLIGQLDNSNSEVVMDAVREIRQHDWHKDRSLQGQNLSYANLQGANLSDASLRGTDLWKANLQGANLSDANLQGASLWEANLQGANLRRANLQGAEFDENTVLPDAKLDQSTNEWTSKWTSETDMRRFTDPDHPNFWSPPDDEN